MPRVLWFRLDLNWVCIAGFAIFGVALAIFGIEHWTESPITVGRILGPGAPWALIPVWMVLAVVAALVYLAGRVLWLIRHHLIRRT
jgi:hypothetical protein